VLIDDQWRKCATFLLVEGRDPETGVLGKHLFGSGFFVTVWGDDKSSAAIYLVTAQHLLDKSEDDGPLFVRMNSGAGQVDFEAPQAKWTRHPSTDVAAIRVPIPPDPGFKSIDFSGLLSDQLVVDHKVGVGDEVFFAGLFSEHPGRQRVQPIIRFGNISMMPVDPIKTPDLRVASEIDAYLVEARSWGGHSGSPAFIYYPSDRSGNSITVNKELPVYLLGLVHGHYEIASDVAYKGDILGSGKVPINAGMAAVVPSQKIIDVLMDDELVQDRRN